MSILQRLPLDLSTFKKLREHNYLYVDKTYYAYELIKNGRRYFLSRPRRFGKSLFISTLKEILEGNEHLFEGLKIKNTDYSWQKYGVIVLDLSTLGIDSHESLKKGLCYALAEMARDFDLKIEVDLNIPELALRAVVKELKRKCKQVAILIDEYDHPILQVLKNLDQADLMRDSIRRFFAAIKGLDSDIDFVFITGVSSFAKAGIFSGMNNLRTITLDSNYSGICGYTEQEVDEYFSLYIQEWVNNKKINFEDLKKKIKDFYNGYYFGKNVLSVYNPFSLMNALEFKDFKNFWFLSGTPTFLVEKLKEEWFFDFENLEISEESLGIMDIGSIPIIPLMFQAGYLTISGFNEETNAYKLDYPNLEVKISFQKYLLGAFANLDTVRAEQIALQLRMALNNENIAEVVFLIENLFSRVPYQLHVKEEKYYHSLLIMVFTSIGLNVHSEYSTSDGRIDLVLELEKKIYIIEVKFNISPDHALKQIKDRQYFKPYFNYNKRMILLGLSFNKKPSQFKIDFKFELLI